MHLQIKCYIKTHLLNYIRENIWEQFGQNGAGKSTLIKFLLKEILPDKGAIKWQNGITIGSLDQYAIVEENKTIFEYLKTAFAPLYDLENNLNKLYIEMAENYTEEIMNKTANYQEKLEKSGFYEIESRIKRVASGLRNSSNGARYDPSKFKWRTKSKGNTC